MLRLQEKELVDFFDKSIALLPIIFDDDISIGITDAERYLKIQNCEKIPINAKPNDPIPSGGAAFEALKTGKTCIRDVPKEVYGVPFKSYAIIIKNDKNITIGTFLIGKSLEERHKVSSMSQALNSSLEKISLSINEVSAGIQNMINLNNDISTEVVEARENTKGTDDILKFVQNVSNQTNLLGLNAAIEAARAGENGKGFSVVAQEIRKLSNTSSESIRRIDSVLRKIEDSVTNISSKVNESNSFFTAQATAFNDILASIEELNSSSKILEEISKKL